MASYFKNWEYFLRLNLHGCFELLFFEFKTLRTNIKHHVTYILKFHSFLVELEKQVSCTLFIWKIRRCVSLKWVKNMEGLNTDPCGMYIKLYSLFFLLNPDVIIIIIISTTKKPLIQFHTPGLAMFSISIKSANPSESS